MQYTVLFLAYAWLMGTFRTLPQHWAGKIIHVGSYAALIALHACEYFLGAVERYPDLWVVGNVLLCFPAFVLAWFWTLRKLWIESKLGKSKFE